MLFAHLSREVLAETLLAAGPGSATLCEGWRTEDLAAHLYLREHRPITALGAVVGPLAKHTDAAIRQLAGRSAKSPEYGRLVHDFLAGPPRLSPLRVPRVDEGANVVEYFIHTEDVRRATDRWAPRALDKDYSDALWNHLIRRAGLLYRGVDAGIILVNPSGARHVVKRAAVSAAIVGEPAELLMHASGRRSHALVTFEGRADVVARLQRT